MKPTVSSRTISTVVAVCFAAYATLAFAQEKKTDDDKPNDPDTGESTVEEKTLGILPQPFQRYGVKFAATYIGEVLGNTTGGVKRGAVYEGRLNLAVDADLDKILGLNRSYSMPMCSKSMEKDCHGITFRTF